MSKRRLPVSHMPARQARKGHGSEQFPVGEPYHEWGRYLVFMRGLVSYEELIARKWDVRGSYGEGQLHRLIDRCLTYAPNTR